MTSRKHPIIAASDVRALFQYSNDGALYWLENQGYQRTAGKPAGTFSTSRGQCVIQFREIKYARSALVWAWHHRDWPSGYLARANGNPADDRIENLKLSNRAVQKRARGASK